MTNNPIGLPDKKQLPCSVCGTLSDCLELPTLAWFLLLSAGCFMWVPFIGWVLAPILFVIAGVAAVAHMAAGSKYVFCRNCKKTVKGVEETDND